MARVKAQLDHEAATGDAADERRKARLAKQYAKEVGAEKRKDKAASRKAVAGGVAKLRADRARVGYAGDLDADAALAALEGGSGVHRLGSRAGAGAPAHSFKRAAKDAKYGRGGKTRGRNNDAASAADVSGWARPERDDGGFSGRGRGRGRGGGRGGAAGPRGPAGGGAARAGGGK